jgi:hypothetical protein
MRAIRIRKNSIHESLQSMNGSESMANRYHKMHIDRIGILLCQNQMSLMPAISLRRSNLHKSLQPLSYNARISNRNPFVSESNVTDASDLHLEKQFAQITSSEEVIQKRLALRSPFENSSQSRTVPWITMTRRLNTVEPLDGF